MSSIIGLEEIREYLSKEKWIKINKLAIKVGYKQQNLNAFKNGLKRKKGNEYKRVNLQQARLLHEVLTRDYEYVGIVPYIADSPGKRKASNILMDKVTTIVINGDHKEEQ